MSFGLLAHNDSGDIIIDAAFQNHVIVQSGTTTISAPNDVGNASLVSFGLPSGSYYNFSLQPLLFVRSTTKYVSFASWHFAGPNGIDGADGFVIIPDSYPVTFDWKLVVVPTAQSAETEGIRVFDANSKAVFDSGLPYLSIVDAITISDPSLGAFSHAAATTPFYCVTSGYMFKNDISGAGNSYNSGYKAVSGTGGSSAWCSFGSSQTSSNVTLPTSAIVLVGDAG